MKILFIGIGSIGCRHAELLLRAGHGLYSFQHIPHKQHLRKKMDTLQTWEEIEKIHPDVAFICSPTNTHIEYAMQCARRGMHLFIEKPIDITADKLPQLLEIVENHGLTAQVGYVLEFHPVVQKLKEQVAGRRILEARFICATQLKDWRIKSFLKNWYSYQAKTGGGAIWELSHEFYMAESFCSRIIDITGNLHRISDQTLDCEDYATLCLNHWQGGTSYIHLNMAAKKTFRRIELSLNDGDYLWGHLNSQNDLDLAYETQMQRFLNALGKQPPINSLRKCSPLFEQLVEFKKHNRWRLEICER